jgi:hypothetical protein
MEDAEADDTTPLKVALFDSLRQQLFGYGFTLKSTKESFLRQREGVIDIFQLVCLDGKPGYRIQPNVAVRVERVEDIFHQTSGFERKYQSDTPTMGAPVGILLSGTDARACEFLLESSSEVTSVVAKIMCVFRECALSYFERWASLQAIDKELNDKPGQRTLHRALEWFRCSTGVIVARLLGRPNYEQLVTFYTDVMARDNKGFYLKRFQALLKSLVDVEADRQNQPV